VLADFTSAVNHSGKWGKSDVAKFWKCVARIVAAWSELPAVLKGAMLAIVDSIGAGGGERAVEDGELGNRANNRS
jgi:hypothetical protein